MHVIYDKSFLKSAKKLPINIQIELANKIELLKNNPFHPKLHTKYLTGEFVNLLSFRITRDWRVIFYFLDPETIHLLKIGHRKDIYR